MKRNVREDNVKVKKTNKKRFKKDKKDKKNRGIQTEESESSLQRQRLKMLTRQIEGEKLEQNTPKLVKCRIITKSTWHYK